MTDVKEITKKLEEGVKGVFNSTNYRAYLAFMSKFHTYSINNSLLIWLQNPEATLVAGYQTWLKKFKRQVRKGEKGIYILAPMPRHFTKTVKNEFGDLEEVEVKYTAYKATTVFDISQTDGGEIPEICKELSGDVEGYDDLFKRLTEISPVPVEFEDIQSGAHGYFSHAEKVIRLKTGMSQMQTIKTLIHEISHAVLHDRESGEEKDADRRTKEVQAESVAFAVCSMLGLDTADYSFEYVANWSAGKEAKELTASMEVIRKTANGLFERIAA